MRLPGNGSGGGRALQIKARPGSNELNGLFVRYRDARLPVGLACRAAIRGSLKDVISRGRRFRRRVVVDTGGISRERVSRTCSHLYGPVSSIKQNRQLCAGENISISCNLASRDSCSCLILVSILPLA